MTGVQGGIIAAGAGSRFAGSGITLPKALIPVGGKPLIGRVIDQFLDAGIDRLSVIFNEHTAGPCGDYLRDAFPNLHLTTVIKTTASSFESFREVLSTATGDHMLLSTVDSLLPPHSLDDFMRFARGLTPQAVALGITDYIDDERPLYIDIDPSGRALALGATPAPYVTCGLYYLAAARATHMRRQQFTSLRAFLGSLVDGGVPVYGLPLGKTIDVDRPQDLAAAERWLASVYAPNRSG